jgi:hypothetical protein
MKKKVLMMGAGLTLGSALLVSSAFADIGGAKGYEAYKSALKNTATVASTTQNISVSILDNGNELMSATTTLKENGAIGGVSGIAAIKAGATSQTIEFYDQGGKKIIKVGDSDTYNVITESGREKWKGKDDRLEDPALNKEMENVVDALVGNLKNYVNLNHTSDGKKTVDVTLTGSQIPAAANVIGSLLVKEALNGKHAQDEWNSQELSNKALGGLNVQQITANFPKLTQDVNIDEVALHAAIDENNYISSQEIDFTISGKDASGQAHKVVISTDIGLSNVNATTPDVIDLAGKKINTIQEQQGHF